MPSPYPLPADLESVEIPMSLSEATKVADIIAKSWPASMPVRDYARRKADLVVVLMGYAPPLFSTSCVGIWSEAPYELH